MRDMDRQIVIVSGAPGAGKTTLAVPLAAGLGFPLVAKDYLKETVWDALGPPVGDLTWSRRTGGAAMELLWGIARRCPTVVLEANFRPHSHYERDQLVSLGGRIVEVHCRCPVDLAARRYAQRAAGPCHHAAHVGRTATAEWLTQFSRPVAVGPVVTVDTSTSPVDIQALVPRVRALLEAQS